MDDSLETIRGHGAPHHSSRYAHLDSGPRYVRQFVDRRAPPVSSWQPQIDRLVGWLRRRIVLIIAITVIGAAAGFAFGTLTPARYTSSSDILVDPAKLQVVANDIYDPGAAREAQLLDAEGKLRILTSGNVLRRVVDDLQLQNDPEFVPPPSAPLFSFGSGPARAVDDKLVAQRNLFEHVRAHREERSFIVSLSVWSLQPEKAVTISNAFVRAFLNELTEADSSQAGRSAQSLTDRLSELRKAVSDADELVESFRRENKLQSSEGELLSARSMGLLNSQMVEAQQRLIEAQGRYEQLRGASGGENADALQSATIASLRSQYATAQQQYQAQLSVLGERHPTLANLRAQVNSLAVQVAAETQRLVDAARIERDQARTALAELESSTAAARSTVSTDNLAQIQLRDLERDATSKAAIYEAFLTRAQQVAEREGIDTTNIRVITPATLPDSRSWPPRTVQTIVAGAASGFMLALLLAAGLGYLAEGRTTNRRSKEAM